MSELKPCEECDGIWKDACFTCNPPKDDPPPHCKTCFCIKDSIPNTPQLKSREGGNDD